MKLINFMYAVIVFLLSYVVFSYPIKKNNTLIKRESCYKEYKTVWEKYYELEKLIEQNNDNKDI
ncbi:hypothetical protein BCR36DRAFT_585512 [Piromyces finnis]|uniref:Uncharacterized protein n=1 Tax=Piromyces finnis TaxID=1754191 RepID=A0A1Y1V3C5_9FUNG|nr:hypothetical protein BCR36DRAFT_585512 [Piromyces finnis]|eukprot:ORX45747.1 hypothetical protein BCR36DRAFT_585512 [Piromyces finnis]